MNVKLFLQERRRQIEALLEQGGQVSVVDLTGGLALSQATIRTDLDVLAEQGLLVRTWGGVIASTEPTFEPSFFVSFTHLRSAREQHKAIIVIRATSKGDACDDVLTWY